MIGAVIFDMDGVLTDSDRIVNEAAMAMFRERGLETRPEDYTPFVGMGEDRYLAGVAKVHGFPIDVAAAKKRTYEIYFELTRSRSLAFPGAVELARRCKTSGLKVALASGGDRVRVDWNLRAIGLPAEWWDAVIAADDVKNKKPAPDIFLAAARALGVDSSACVVIEDAVNGVKAARAAAMRCVAVAHTFTADQLGEADVVRDRIAAVAPADLVG